MGRLPLSAFYALLPWPFFFFERLRFPSRQIPAVIGGALTLGALPFAHPGYAFWGTALLTLYIGIRFLIARSTWPLKKLGKYALILVLGGLILGACLTLPMWLERAHVGLDVSGQDGHNTGLPSPTWKHLFYWSNYRLVLFSFSEQHWFGSYLGLSLILTACLGLIGMGVRHPRTSLLASGTVCLIGSLVLVFGHHLPAVRAIPAVQMLYPWRYLLFVSFFLSLMVGAGVTLVLPRLSKKQPYPYYTLLLLLILLDLGTTTFQHPYLPAQNEAGLTHMSSNLYQNLRDEASEFPDGALPNYRYFYLSDTNMSFLPNAWIPSQTGIPSAFNAYVEDPLAAHKFCMPLYDYLNPVFSRFKSPDDLQASEQLGVIAAGFYLLNIRHIFSFQSDIKQLFHWTWLYNSPIVVASQTAGWDLWKAQNNIALNQNPDLVTLLTQMGVNVLNHTCQRIFLDGQAPLQNLHTTPQVEVRSHQVWNQRVALTVHTSAPCFARLAYAHYPYLQVTVNGEFQDPLQTAGGFIALKLEGGTHKIVLEPYLSPLRRVLLILNAILILAATGLLIQFRRSKGRNSTRVPSPKETDCL